MPAADQPRPAGAGSDEQSLRKEAEIAVKASRRDRAQSPRTSASADSMPRPDIEEAEDWVVSYMDMVTLLMIVFLGMVAIMTIERKFDRIDMRERGAAGQVQSGSAPIASSKDSSGGSSRVDGRTAGPRVSSWPISPGENDILPGPTDSSGTEDTITSAAATPVAGKKAAATDDSANSQPPLSPDGRKLLDSLLKSGLPKEIAFETTDRQIRIQISDKVLFASGQADLSGDGGKVIRQILPFLQSMAGVISVEGHTDDVPISTARFPSNWELSAARAGAVTRLLADQGIAPTRLRAIGYADTRPVAAPPAGRSLNRRVTLVVEP